MWRPTVQLDFFAGLAHAPGIVAPAIVADAPWRVSIYRRVAGDFFEVIARDDD
jgi:hypothetical protein